MKQFWCMTQAIKSKKYNDFPSTGIMEKYLNGTQNTRFKISSRVTILQTCVGKLHATQRAQGNKDREKLHAIRREHRETEAEKSYMFCTDSTGNLRQGFQLKSCRKNNASKKTMDHLLNYLKKSNPIRWNSTTQAPRLSKVKLGLRC